MSNPKIQDPEAFLREMLRRDFGSFLRKAYPYISGGEPMLWNWHLEAIAYQLSRVERATIYGSSLRCHLATANRRQSR
jgi:hypothetical protein